MESFPANIHLFEISNKITRFTIKKFTIKKTNKNDTNDVVLVFVLLILNIFYIFF